MKKILILAILVSMVLAACEALPLNDAPPAADESTSATSSADEAASSEQAPRTGRFTGAAPAAASPADAAQVDLNALARQIFEEVNKVRTNPTALATNLAAMKQGLQSSSGSISSMTLTDGTTMGIRTSDLGYLDSAISTAQTLQPMAPLTWSEGLAQATKNYAIRNPQGHSDFGTTMSSRAAEFGQANGSMAESINYGGATGLNQTYGLYIDAGVTSLGHRTMMIDPKYTDFGVGCFYPNNYNDITCVLNYAENWVEKMNMVKPEIGKQYAHSEGDGKFRYFVLSSVTNRGQFPVRIEVCPDKMGWVDMPDTAGLTTVEAALAEGLVATNTPCATDAAPHGILNNGASLPVTSSSGQNEQTQEVKLPFVAGNAMVQGQKYFSESGNHYLIFQTDGNLVVYTADDKYVWGIGALTREYQQAQSVSMEADGNFVVRGADNAKIWSALQANPDASASLTLTPEGALQLVSGAGVLWSSIERPFDEPTDGRLPLTAGQTLTEREKYFSESGNHYLVFQTDGNLVVYTADDKFVWGLNTVTDRYQQAVSVQMQSDGNLVVRGADNQPVWSALDANPDPGASLVLTPEGVLQLVSGSGDIMWTSDR